jgi:cyclase
VGLVKTQGFKEPKYVGDPINAVRILTRKKSDELMVLDIDATVLKAVSPDFALIAKLAAECRMPLCYGGGVNHCRAGCTHCGHGCGEGGGQRCRHCQPGAATEMAAAVGRQSWLRCWMCAKKHGTFSKGYEVCTHNAKQSTSSTQLRWPSSCKTRVRARL